jgi:tRNA-uridine 2-sulfurtransferase
MRYRLFLFMAHDNNGEPKVIRRCISLYSGGLDSILVVKMLQEQGVEVIPLHFCTPFFDFQGLRAPDTVKAYHKERYGITIHPIDFTSEMIGILSNPKHGFGKHFNPCIDCKIGMIKKASTLLKVYEASFVATGEVLGQRPMSQRRDTMNVIIKETGCKDILLRPLCAKLMPPTLPEREGLVDRELLGSLSGRGRKEQIALAHKYGIDPSNIPTPAGGCLLTYESTAARVKMTFERFKPGLPSLDDIMLDVVGRKFNLDAQTVLVVSRDESETERVSTMARPGNIFLKMADVPGPLCVIRGDISEGNLRNAASICLRYSRVRGTQGQRVLYGPDPNILENSLEAPVLGDERCKSFQIDLQG